MTNVILYAIAAIASGLAVGKLVNSMIHSARRKEAYDRILWQEAAERAHHSHDLRRIAAALEAIAAQFPEDKAPYFERLLISLQEWRRV
jgi:hypothetical protein